MKKHEGGETTAFTCSTPPTNVAVNQDEGFTLWIITKVTPVNWSSPNQKQEIGSSEKEGELMADKEENNDNKLTKLSDLLLGLRALCNLSRKQLAAKLGVSVGVISMLEQEELDPDALTVEERSLLRQGIFELWQNYSQSPIKPKAEKGITADSNKVIPNSFKKTHMQRKRKPIKHKSRASSLKNV